MQETPNTSNKNAQHNHRPHHLFYGEDSHQFGMLYVPEISPPNENGFPVIILIHGGFWKAQYDLKPLDPLAQAFVQLGFAVWNIEYRCIGSGGGFPETLQDVASAAEYLKTISHQYNLDLSAIMTVGHSAGGHLALWLAARPNIRVDSVLFQSNPIHIFAVVSLAGVADLNDAAHRNFSEGIVLKFMGGSAANLPLEYQAASPHALLPLNIPQWHIVGENDTDVPCAYIQQYVNYAKLYDVTFLDIVANLDHMSLIDPESKAWEFIKNAVLSLLKKCN